jgi:glycyl-tRNA synthetase (class II)
MDMTLSVKDTRNSDPYYIFAAMANGPKDKHLLWQTVRFQAIISHCKEYGFIFPSSEIYDGLSAVYDYGQYGSELKKNIKDHWWKSMTQLHENIVGIDAAIFMHPTTWKASGHVDNFSDPMIDNKDSKKRYRVDHLIEARIDELEKKAKKPRRMPCRPKWTSCWPPVIGRIETTDRNAKDKMRRQRHI